jgi:hypothetical protein
MDVGRRLDLLDGVGERRGRLNRFRDVRKRTRIDSRGQFLERGGLLDGFGKARFRLRLVGGVRYSRRGLRLFYSFKYSRNRRVCERLTGISVALASFILRM